MRYNLLIPFDKKDEVKKSFGIKWDNDKKTWYYICNGELPEGLDKYTEMVVDVRYEDKDLFKKRFKTMRWNNIDKYWTMSKEEYDIVYKTT
jgi:hypothetical protein